VIWVVTVVLAVWVDLVILGGLLYLGSFGCFDSSGGSGDLSDMGS